MALNDIIRRRGTRKVLQSAGAAVANNAPSAISAASYNVGTDGGQLPDVELTLAVTFATAPTAGTTVAVYLRARNVDGAGANAETPNATVPGVFAGSFAVNALTTQQWSPPMLVRDAPEEFDAVIHNVGTGQQITAWTLIVQPYGYGPASA